MEQEINGENLDLPCSKKIYGEKFDPRVTLCKLLYGRCTVTFQALENGLSLVLESIQSFVLLYLQICRIVTFGRTI
jgi:hypothetical protein